jgi:predicted enzyme related to lactoylglutathione lyase
MLKGVDSVFVDVEDQERAKRFWTETMGFQVNQDAPYGEERWLEVRSPDGGVILVLGQSPTGPGDRAAVRPELPTSSVTFYCNDIEATYEELTARGVQFPQPPVQQSWGWWSLFLDEEGNRFALSTRS